MGNLMKTVLFLSAFSPIFLSLSVVKYLNSGIVEDVFYYAFAGIIGISITLLIIGKLKKSAEVISFSAKKIESNDAMLLGVVASYFVPFVAKASEITMGGTIVLTITVAVILWFMSSIPPHPLLRVLSFRFYKVESAAGVVYTLISQRELLDPKEVRQVKRISSSMLMETT